MIDKRAIVDDLAKRKVVETMVQNIARRSVATPELQDLAQMVYLVILEYDTDKIEDLYLNDELGFFIARVILNQYRSNTSPFYYQLKKFNSNAAPLEGHDRPDR